MAEELGTAVLRITVDDKAAKDSLRELRRNISAATKLSSGGRAAIQEDERRFQIAQRIKRLEKEGVDVTRLRSRLQDANRARLNGDLETQRRITAELGRQVQLVERRFRPRAQGGASESVFALEKAQERRFRLAQKIDRLENQGADVSRLRSGLGKVTEALANREFEAQRRLSVELSRQVRLTEARLRLQRDTERETRRVARAEITEGRRVGRLNTSPVRGGIAFPGSPEARAATLAADQAIVSRNLKVRTSWAKALDFLDDTAALIAFNAKAAAQAEGRRIGKLNVSPVGGSKLIPGSPAFLDAIFPAFPKDYFAKQRAAEAEGLRIGRLNTAPVRGGAAFAGSPAFLDSIFPKFPKEYFAKQAREVKAASQKQQGIISNAIIGGAFPLLFGQGIGASIGGAAGGAAGGAIGGQFGFGLSLVGTALGAQFDAVIQKAALLGSALDNPIAKFEELRQAGLLSSKGLEKQIEVLIAIGANATAAAAIQRDLTASYGGADAAKRLVAAQDELNRSWALLSVNLGQLGLPLIADLATDAAQSLGGFAAAVQFIRDLTKDFPIPQGNAPGSAFFNPLSGGFGTAALIEGGKGLGRLFGRGDDGAEKAREAEAAAADDLTNALVRAQRIENRRLATQGIQLKAITAQVQGYDRAAAALQRQAQAEQNAADIDDARRRRSETEPGLKGAVERQKIDTEIRNLQNKDAQDQQSFAEKQLVNDRTRLSVIQLQTEQFQIQSQAIDRQIKNVIALGRVEQGAARDALLLRQQVTDEINAARDAESKIASSIQAARARGGGELTQELRDLYDQQALAAKGTELALKRGSLAITDAGTKLLKDADSARNSLRSAQESAFDLLRRSDQISLVERARADIRSSGVFDPVKISRLQERDLISAASSARSIVEARTNLNAVEEATSSLVGVNAELNTNVTNLTTQVIELTQKDWNVYITSNYTGSAAQELLAAATLP